VATGRLITIEGLDGAGKTTLAHALVDELRERERERGRGRDTRVDVELLREPGGVALSERIRELVKDPSLRVGAPAEALLYAAARAQLVEELLRPLLAQGTTVLLDRFVDSSLAYQGAARGLGIEDVRAINALATGGLQPDRTLLLRVSPRTGRERAGERGHEPDRLEREGEGFFAAIAAAYDELALAEPKRIRTIDAEQSPAEVLAQALSAVEDLFSMGS
jgi:dTMP kinase